MVISGIYIKTIPGAANLAAEELGQVNGVEVHFIEPSENKIVITLETDTVDRSYRTAEGFKDISGILAICLVYTNFEDEPAYQNGTITQ
ncbi:chaperone NapD [Mesobacillus harenae]|uniref:chaperone NapD n=1 Tax=Mesobacillus harenae TaxID=2213203 RepID=UPI00158051C6|nr:chaperone NapD [Mesobacillus harenae]